MFAAFRCVILLLLYIPIGLWIKFSSWQAIAIFSVLSLPCLTPWFFFIIFVGSKGTGYVFPYLFLTNKWMHNIISCNALRLFKCFDIWFKCSNCWQSCFTFDGIISSGNQAIYFFNFAPFNFVCLCLYTLLRIWFIFGFFSHVLRFMYHFAWLAI